MGTSEPAKLMASFTTIYQPDPLSGRPRFLSLETSEEPNIKHLRPISRLYSLHIYN